MRLMMFPWLCVCCASFANTSQAQDDERPPRLAAPQASLKAARKHDGMMFRGSLELGIGPVRSRQLDWSPEESAGMGFGFALDAGAAVIDNLVVFGRVRGYSPNGLGVHTSSSFGALGLRIGVGYFLPGNFGVGAALGPSWASKKDRPEDMRMGFGFELEAGKQWWMGRHWGIGPGLRFSYATMSGDSTVRGSYQRLTLMLIAALISVSYG